MPPKSRKNAKFSKSEQKTSQQSTPAVSPFPPSPAQLPGEPQQQSSDLLGDFAGNAQGGFADTENGRFEDQFAGFPIAATSDSSFWPNDFGSSADNATSNDLVSFDFGEPNTPGHTISPSDLPPIPIPTPRNQTPLDGSIQDDEPTAASPVYAVPSSPPVKSSLSASLRKHAHTPSLPARVASPAAAAAPSPPRSPPVPNISVKHPSRPVSPPTPIVSKRYPAPAQLTKLEGATAAPVAAVVDLGTARRGSVSSGVPKKNEARPVTREGRVEQGTEEEHEVNPSKVLSGSHSVLWSRWDNVRDSRGSLLAKLLFIGYKDPASLSIWDCSKLDSLSEVFRAEVGSLMEESGEWVICFSGVLPETPRLGARLSRNDGPLVGILVGPDGDTTTNPGRLLLYSLQLKRIVNKIDLEGSGRVDKLAASSSYIAISTTGPPQIQIFSATTFQKMHVYEASHISPFNPPAAQSGLPLHSSAGAAVLSKIAAYSQLASPIVSQARRGAPERKFGHGYGRSLDAQEAARMQAHRPADLEAWDHEDIVSAHKPSYYEQSHPAPVFSVSHRLLAFASPLPSASRSSTPAEFSAPSSYGAEGKLIGLGMGSGPAGLPGNQAELGSAALRVGGSVWGGMKTLGGMALSAARNKVVGNTGDSQVGLNAGRGAKLFSRSAPEGSGDVGEWMNRGESSKPSSSPTEESSSALPSTPTHTGTRCQVRVIDLSRLDHSQKDQKDSTLANKVAEFALSKEKQPAILAFSSDGCSLAVAPFDGHTIKVYQLRPYRNLRPDPSISPTEPAPTSPLSSPIHVYNLRRGRTPAIVDSLEWSGDGRWLTALTRKRTGHLFAINPYGGKTDAKGHLEGKVRNPSEPASSPTDLYPVVRIRAATIEQDQLLPSFSFGLIKPTDYLQPSSFTSPPRSMVSDTGPSPPLSPHDRRRPPTYADGIMFDHITATMSLRRIFLDLKPRDQGYTIASSAGGFGSAGLSLPGIGTPIRVSASSSFKSSSPLSGGIPSPAQQRLQARTTNTSQPPDSTMELVATEHIVMTWNLRRPWDGSQLRKPLRLPAGPTDNTRNSADWLAQAELSTHSRAKLLIPRPIYLSHQFLFHTLGEDYHALIRGYQLEVVGNHIEVRKQIQVSAYPAGEGESFVEGFTSPHDIRHRTVSSSFDEPLASALGADLEQPQSSTVLPMYPNGPPTRGPPLRNSIPIRTVAGISDNVTGRIRRELQRVRSPRLKPKSDDASSSVPLEFDEEDEDFIDPHSRATPVMDSQARHASKVQRASLHDLDPGTNEGDLWGDWSSTDRLAIAEAEKFDDIDVLGILDEEASAQRGQR